MNFWTTILFFMLGNNVAIFLRNQRDGDSILIIGVILIVNIICIIIAFEHYNLILEF